MTELVPDESSAPSLVTISHAFSWQRQTAQRENAHLQGRGVTELAADDSSAPGLVTPKPILPSRSGGDRAGDREGVCAAQWQWRSPVGEAAGAPACSAPLRRCAARRWTTIGSGAAATPPDRVSASASGVPARPQNYTSTDQCNAPPSRSPGQSNTQTRAERQPQLLPIAGVYADGGTVDLRDRLQRGARVSRWALGGGGAFRGGGRRGFGCRRAC